MVVDGVTIDDDSDMYVIAEIGQNHEGDVEKCKQLFDAAKMCGAQSVKLQKRQNSTLYTKAKFAETYNSENAYAPTYGEHREKLEFSREQYMELRDYSKKIGITMFSTAWDYASADLLESIDMPAYKIASGDLRTIPLIKHIASFGKPMFISTGGGTLQDVRRMFEAVYPINKQLCIMQCTSGYPPKFEELNIRVIETFRKEFPEAVIGFSSHDSGIAMALVGWVSYARLIRAETLVLKHSDFVIAAQSLGYSHARIMFRHIMPNAIVASIVFSMSDVVLVILAGAAISYLGLGVQPPAAEWGIMIAEGQNFITTAWWITTFPGLAIVGLAFGFSLLADGLGELLGTRE